MTPHTFRGLATLATGIALVGAAIVALGWMLWGARRAGDRGPYMSDVCRNHVIQVAAGLLMYADDYDDALPRSSWTDEVGRYLPSAHPQCPSVPAGRVGYAMEQALRGARVESVGHPEASQLVFDSKALGRNVVGSLELLPDPPRHPGGNNVAYLDLHVARVPRRSR